MENYLLDNMNSMIYKLIAGMLLIVIVANTADAQNLTARTNKMSLDLSGGALKETGSLPTIEWLYPKQDYSSTEENKIILEARIDSKELIKSIFLIVAEDNSKNVLVRREIELGENSLAFDLKQDLWLPTGTSNITIEVTNTDLVKVSESRSVVVGKNALDNVLAMNRKDYALLFATDRYNNWDDLVNPQFDVETIGQILEEKYGFQVEIVTNATLDQMWEKIRDYGDLTYNKQDQLLVFFAGHGQFDEAFNEGYVVASNSLKNDKGKTTYLSHNRLRGVLDNFGCEHILLAMDVCFGGTFDPVLARARGEEDDYSISDDEVIIRKLRERTRKYLTSGGKEYVPDGRPGHHSPFASRLIQSLRTNGGDDRILTMSEIKMNMENLAIVPRFGSFGSDKAVSDFVFITKN